MARRLLLIAYTYPPAASVSLFRPAKMAKYLPDYGWEVDVLTVDREVPHNGANIGAHGNVHRTPELLSNYFRNRHAGIRWLLPMARKARQLHQRRDYDVLIATGGPFPPFPVTAALSKLLKVPYVLDFRDPWAPKMRPYTDGHDSIPSKIYASASNLLERPTATHAAVCLTPVPELTERYGRAYPSGSFETIFNGFDPDDYEVPPEPAPNKTRLVFPGKYREDFDSVLQYLQGTTTELVYFGKDNTMQRRAEELGVKDNIDWRGYQSLNSVAACLKSADWGVAVTCESAAIPQKVYDYFACGTPILAIDPYEGALSDIVRETETGIAVQDEKISELIDRDPNVNPDGEAVQRYSRESQAARLANVLEERY